MDPLQPGTKSFSDLSPGRLSGSWYLSFLPGNLPIAPAMQGDQVLLLLLLGLKIHLSFGVIPGKKALF